MKKITLDESNFQAALEYIRQQMANQSWWPREQPQQAKDELLLMQGSAAGLNAWCERWLQPAQWRQLGQAVSRSIPSIKVKLPSKPLPDRGKGCA